MVRPVQSRRLAGSRAQIEQGPATPQRVIRDSGRRTGERYLAGGKTPPTSSRLEGELALLRRAPPRRIGPGPLADSFKTAGDLADKDGNVYAFRLIQGDYVRGATGPYSKRGAHYAYSLDPRIAITWFRGGAGTVLVGRYNIRTSDTLLCPRYDGKRRFMDVLRPETPIAGIEYLDEVQVPLDGEQMVEILTADHFVGALCKAMQVAIPPDEVSTLPDDAKPFDLNGLLLHVLPQARRKVVERQSRPDWKVVEQRERDKVTARLNAARIHTADALTTALHDTLQSKGARAALMLAAAMFSDGNALSAVHETAAAFIREHGTSADLDAFFALLLRRFPADAVEALRARV